MSQTREYTLTCSCEIANQRHGPGCLRVFDRAVVHSTQALMTLMMHDGDQKINNPLLFGSSRIHAGSCKPESNLAGCSNVGNVQSLCG